MNSELREGGLARMGKAVTLLVMAYRERFAWWALEKLTHVHPGLTREISEMVIKAIVEQSEGPEQ